MAKMKKRGAVYGIIALMLGVAVYLNWSYVSTPDDLLVAGQVEQKEKDLPAKEKTEEGASSSSGTEADAVSAKDYFAQSPPFQRKSKRRSNQYFERYIGR